VFNMIFGGKKNSVT